jgi:hypothetical protein
MINTENNFWKEYPELKLAPGLDKIYNNDKSKGKATSSKLMWAIDMCENPESKFYYNPEKYQLVAKAFLKDPKFDWTKYEKEKDFYRECCLSDAERALTIWNETMRQRNNSLKEMYQDALEGRDVDTLVKLDKMLALTPKMFDDYKKIKQDYEEEKLKRTGKSISSLSDNDEI